MKKGKALKLVLREDRIDSHLFCLFSNRRRRKEGSDKIGGAVTIISFKKRNWQLTAKNLFLQVIKVSKT
jgi:hypothetical protein